MMPSPSHRRSFSSPTRRSHAAPCALEYTGRGKRTILAGVNAIVAAAIAAATAANAADYYVSSVRAGRGDDNAGTSSSAPWATFTKVMQSWGGTIKAGDTVHLERGSVWDYSLSGDWRLPAGGSAAAGPITLRGDDYGTGNLPMVRRSSGGANAVAFWVRDVSYVTLRDFVVDGGSAQGMNTVAVLIGGSGQNANVSHVNVLRLVCQNLASSSSYYVSGIFCSANGGHTVSDCTIDGNSVSGFNAHGLNHYAEKSATKNPSLMNHIVWRNNNVFNANAAHYGAIGSGIHIAFGGSDNVFEYNCIDGNEYIGSIFLMNCANDETGLTIRYNVVKNNGSNDGMVFTYDSAGANCTVQADVYGNVFYGASRAGIDLAPGGHYSGTVNIYNNTFYGNNTSGSRNGEVYADSSASSLTMNLRNNLFYPTQGSTAGINVSGGTLNHDHNLFWHKSGTAGPAVVFKGSSYSVASVKNFESTAQNVEPQLGSLSSLPTAVNSTSGASPSGLLQKTGSSAIDTGAALATTYSADIARVSRPQGPAWDLGAYEAVTGTAPSPAPAAPSALTAAALSTTAIALTWKDNAADETGFRVESSPDGVTFTALASISSNVTAYTASGLLAGCTGYFRVCAMRGTTPSGYSNVAQATTQPAAPTGLAPAM